MKTSSTTQKVVPKDWGYEVWITNTPAYCGKLLHLNGGHRCSLHFHKLKDETFYVETGVVEITHGRKADKSDFKYELLGPGDTFHVPVGLIHQMEAVGGPARLFEFSTQHFDSDSHRITAGGKAPKRQAAEVQEDAIPDPVAENG